MDSPIIPTTNIVAAAMSTANLTIPPELSKFTAKTEATSSPSVYSAVPSPVRVQTSNCDPPTKLEKMETTNHSSTNRGLTRQVSQECDSLPRHMANASMTTALSTKQGSPEEVSKYDSRSAMKTNSNSVTSVSTSSDAFNLPAINGDKTALMSCGSSIDENLINVAMEVSSSTSLKPSATSSDIARPKPSEDTTYPITCGPNKAELVWKKFICPGINAKCVKCGDNWYTPKEFVNLAGKSTLKDWKRAIRINGIMLRRLIENGELNYYEHESNCSNQCRSNKNNLSFEYGPDGKLYSSMDSESNGREHSLDHQMMRSSSEDPAHYPAKKTTLHSLYLKTHENASSLAARNSLERSSSEDSGLAASPHLDGMLMRDIPVTMDKIQELERFWTAVSRLDFFDDIMHDVTTNIMNIHSRTKTAQSMNVEDAITLTNLMNCLELFPSIVQLMSLHKHKVEKETEESSLTRQELEKKLAEQKKYEQDLKRKSRQLDNVMQLTPNEKRQKRNILRIGRQKAVESRVPPSIATGSSSQSLSQPDIRDNVMLAAVSRAGIVQQNMWSSALQVDPIARAAATSQIAAHMNAVSTTPGGIALPPFSLFPSTMRSSTDPLLVSSSLQQAFATSSQGSRDSTQSPKK